MENFEDFVYPVFLSLVNDMKEEHAISQWKGTFVMVFFKLFQVCHSFVKIDTHHFEYTEFFRVNRYDFVFNLLLTDRKSVV